MKILYIITQSELGGAQKNVLDLAVGLKNKHTILVAAGPDGNGRFFEELRKNQIFCVRLKYLRRAINPYFDLRGLLEIKKLIKKEQPDVLHLHSSKAGVLGSLAGYLCSKKKSNVLLSDDRKLDASIFGSSDNTMMKIIYTVHGAVFTAAFSAMAQKIFLWLEKYTAKFKDKIICVSTNDKKLWLEYGAATESKLIVVRNGIDAGKIGFLEKENSREKLSKLLDVRHPRLPSASPPPDSQARALRAGQAIGGQANSNDKNLKIVGTIANFYPEKGLAYLIKAAKIMNKNAMAPEAIFVVIGEGRERKMLGNMIRERNLENRFFLVGAVPDAAKYLKAFDVFALPSIKEGFPYVLLEAMSAGLPVVSSLVGGTPEIIKNGEDGFLILSKNPKILAERIADILDNPELAEKLSRKAEEKVREFSVERMIAETERVYLEK